jgi:hypothetical protein
LMHIYLLFSLHLRSQQMSRNERYCIKCFLYAAMKIIALPKTLVFFLISNCSFPISRLCVYFYLIVVGILSDVIVFLLTKKKYDARGRSLSRNLYKALRTGLNEYFLADEFDAISMKSLHPITANTMDRYNWIRTFEALENTLIATISRLLNQPTAVEISSSSTTKSSRFNPLNTVSSLYARVRPTNPNPSPNLNPLGNTKNDSKQKEKSQTSKMIRFAKIGAVGLGVGAVLAVTGGLAAPAICGALLVMGTTGAGSHFSYSTNFKVSDSMMYAAAWLSRLYCS